jgi:hypothetical protein
VCFACDGSFKGRETRKIEHIDTDSSSITLNSNLMPSCSVLWRVQDQGYSLHKTGLKKFCTDTQNFVIGYEAVIEQLLKKYGSYLPDSEHKGMLYDCLGWYTGQQTSFFEPLVL